MRRIVSVIMLILLLTGMLTMAYNIQPVKADFKTGEAQKSFSVDALRFIHNGTNHNKKGNKEQARIVEHRIATLELEKLKREIGVWEESRNYNQIIDGHGTGLRPPKEEEWAEIVNKIYMVERVLLNETIQFPSSVDHTTKPWFPPIGDQDEEGSCVAWAVGYYMKTFQEAKEHGWDLSGAEWKGGYPTPAYQDRIFSPDFIYHLINGGVDQGSHFSDAINLVCAIGASSWEKMPYDPADSTSWPSENAWREAPLYRGNSSGYEYLELNTDDDLISLKNFIASDHLALISVDAYRYSNLTSEDFWTLDNYVNISTNHANTIVGYNDDIKYLEQGEWRYGAFKIANSWGEGDWENIPDGCYWISYEALKQRVEHCMFYRDRTGYGPELVSSFRIDHFKRGECDISIGMGNHSNPATTKSFSDLIDGGGHPFCSNNIVFDITEFKDVVPKVISQSFFMEVYDEGVPPAHSGVYKWYSDGASYSWYRLGQTFDIPETGATLKFWSYYEIEEDWDYGYVEVHDLDADEWYTLPGLMTVSTLPERQDNPNCPSEFEPAVYYDARRWNAFTGFSSVMYQEEMDLTPFASHTIELYFTYWTDPLVLERGWYIDDIEIPEVGFFDDVESGPSDWTYNGWYITIPITTGTISSFSIEYYHNYSSNSLSAESASYDVPLNTTDQNHVFAELILMGVCVVNVNVSEAKQMIESNSDLVILDVRNLEEYESGHMENAVLIPVTELEDRINELDKQKDILVYCKSGGRSATASEILVANGFSSVYNMLGGITAWRNAGHWIEILHIGDLIIDGAQTFLIENCTYIQTGNIFVRDWAKLLVRNAEIQMNQTYFLQYEFKVEDYGTLELEDAVLRSDQTLNLDVFQYSKASLRNVTLVGAVWFSFGGYSDVSIYQLTYFGDHWIHLSGYCDVSMENSRIFGMKIYEETCNVKLSGSFIDHTLWLGFSRGSIVDVNDLKPGFHEYFDLKEKVLVYGVLIDVTLNKTFVNSWGIGVYYDSETVISNSVLGGFGIWIRNLSVGLDGLNLQFYEYKRVGQITLNKTEIKFIEVSIFEKSDVTITNSTICIVHVHDSSDVSLINSMVYSLKALGFFGSLCFEGITLERVEWMMYSDFYIYGNVSLEEFREVWLSCNVTRNYSIVVKDRYSELVSNTSLILLSEEDVIIWNGTTDNQGSANFNLTFTDGNYTETLRLKAVEGNFTATENIGFLSDTPVVLKMRYFADLNGDGTVNIFDMFIIAKAFRTKEGDENWNPIADLDDNKEINIIDLYKVAKDYGKTI